MVHRKLTRTAEHHASLLRNLVTNVLEHESITTTHAKAKEAQVAVDRLITAAKHLQAKQATARREDVLRRTQILQNRLFKPEQLFPKLMGELVARYASLDGGYTRVLKLEPRLGDNAPQSILELVNGKRDMRFAMTAKAVARATALGERLHPVTVKNMRKLTKTPEETQKFEAAVEEMKARFFANVQQGEQTVAEVVNRRRAPVVMKPNPLSQ